MNKESSSENERTGPPPKAKEVQVWSRRSRLFRPHTSTRRNCHGSHWIAEWPIPNKVKDVRSFLGFTNYYRRFIGDYSNITCPLIDLTKKNKEWKWSPSCQKAFDQLREEFSKQPILSLPNLNKPFAIATDTSKDASGGILLQADSNGEWHPCSYLSQSFSPTERNYNIYD